MVVNIHHFIIIQGTYKNAINEQPLMKTTQTLSSNPLANNDLPKLITVLFKAYSCYFCAQKTKYVKIPHIQFHKARFQRLCQKSRRVLKNLAR